MLNFLVKLTLEVVLICLIIIAIATTIGIVGMIINDLK